MRAAAERGGSGVIVLPCGAGKTIVGMACMAAGRSPRRLILTTSVTATRQWMAELLDKTTLGRRGNRRVQRRDQKDVRPVTVATYKS